MMDTFDALADTARAEFTPDEFGRSHHQPLNDPLSV
jgi:hypothetical protein